MSSTVFIDGTLIPVDLMGLSINEYVTKKIQEEDPNKEVDHWDIDDYIYDHYLQLHDKLYKWSDDTKEDRDGCADFCRLKTRDDGSIDVICQFYDGGACASEVIEEAYDKMMNIKYRKI